MQINFENSLFSDYQRSNLTGNSFRLKSNRKILFVLLFVISASFQIQAQYRNKCPDYMWGIEYVPVTYLGFEDAPAKVSYLSYGDNEVEGKFLLGIGLVNLSDKTIKSLKFHWYLFHIDTWRNTHAEDRATFLKKISLAQDEISIDEIDEFKPKERFEARIKLPCEEISEEVGSVGTGKGLMMEFVVSEISYNDNSNWKRK